MRAEDIGGQSPLGRPRRPARWLDWVAAVVLLVAAFSYFVVKPLAERFVRGAGALVATIAQAAAAAAHDAYDDARQRVEQSDEAKSLFGEPMQFAPIEETEWLDNQGNDELQFKIKVSGPKGSGAAHAVAAPSDRGLDVKRVELTGPDGAVIALPLP